MCKDVYVWLESLSRKYRITQLFYLHFHLILFIYLLTYFVKQPYTAIDLADCFTE